MKIPLNGIDGVHGAKAVSTASTERAGAGEANAAKAGGVTAGPASVRDAFSSRIQAMRNEVAAGDVVDHAKVERVAKAIADGTFTVDAGVVADRMLRSAVDMLWKPK